jgi:hypothetical protein
VGVENESAYSKFLLRLHVFDFDPVLLDPAVKLPLDGLAFQLLVLKHLQHRLVLGRQVAVLRLFNDSNELVRGPSNMFIKIFCNWV